MERLNYAGPGMESRVDELKRYVRFTAEDAQRLAAFAPRAAPHFERVALEFYERVREHEEAHAVLTGEDQIRRLQRSMVRWIAGLFDGIYDEAYFANTEQVGRVHVKVGLPQRYMLTAMALIRASLTRVIVESGEPDAPAVADALSRLLDLELAVMLESYREDLVARVKRAALVEHEASRRRAARMDEQYLRAVELSPLVVMALDERSEVVLFNEAAERATGFERDEVVGRSFGELFLPSGERDRAAAIEGAGPGERVELPLLTRAGKLRDYRWRVGRSTNGSGVILVGDDVTDERVERVRRQQQERLAAVGTLAAGLAHEIRNPLNGARLHVAFLERTLQKGCGSDEALEAVHVVGDEIQRLARLVTDFLDFARPRPLALENASIQALCGRATGLVAATAEAAGVTLTSDLPPRDIGFEADAQRLEQVLLNLLHNAIEALAPAGGGAVVLRARREPYHVWIEVEDDGPGLPDGHVPVFDAFFSTKPHGTGLGLAIVHRIVSDHGGTIDVDSRPGQTRFRLKLPLTR